LRRYKKVLAEIAGQQMAAMPAAETHAVPTVAVPAAAAAEPVEEEEAGPHALQSPRHPPHCDH
jgi:hypothetical protein